MPFSRLARLLPSNTSRASLLKSANKPARVAGWSPFQPICMDSGRLLRRLHHVGAGTRRVGLVRRAESLRDRSALASERERGNRRRGSRHSRRHRKRRNPARYASASKASILRGPNGTGKFNRLSGTGRTMLDSVAGAGAERAIIASRSGPARLLAAFPPATPIRPTPAACKIDGAEPGGALARDYRSRTGLPVINIAGCAPHPGWIMETLLALWRPAISTAADLDALGRPTFFAGHLAHHGCCAQRIL